MLGDVYNMFCGSRMLSTGALHRYQG